jgi:hypothetical protein
MRTESLGMSQKQQTRTTQWTTRRRRFGKEATCQPQKFTSMEERSSPFYIIKQMGQNEESEGQRRTCEAL